MDDEIESAREAIYALLDLVKKFERQGKYCGFDDDDSSQDTMSSILSQRLMASSDTLREFMMSAYQTRNILYVPNLIQTDVLPCRMI